MSLESTIAENTQALRDLIAALSKGIPTTAAQVEAVVTEAKVVEKTVEKKTQPEETKAVEQKVEQAETFPDGEGVTYQDAAAAITKLSRTKGRDAAVALLSKFGAAKLPDVKPEQFADVIAAATAEMGL